ncbi:hypothetical protein BN7_378 [Wickerhamomyces ciferrii]|uniref:Protein BFR2 n=1 Tax=Wickerhamomyces ciferrii (strain ATCC 14091 / BCRC 22168 / CBS 111 / JCM 3599 / NBRC 0793 / NRRL Y-1031 F-60-10) TaxID=1206466 RepID=K0KHK7_WICCF|nr:uncharacterized protein BN7_378 [Wickerhamomyces ciferrii]CCH40844.1 hypothetical protein BN7_378 [Wickerhamomyces ciferrii]
MAKKTLAEQIADLQKPANPDFDIEDAERDDVFNHDDEEGASLDEDEDDTKKTEHYVKVGKSKLRDHSVNLKDQKYTGKASSRKDIFGDDEESNDEQEDDEEESEEDDEDEEETGSEDDTTNSRNGNGFIDDEAEDDEDDDNESDSGVSLRADSEDEDNSDQSVSQSESESEPETDVEDVTSKRENLKKLMANERKQILNRLSTSGQSDALKGYAVISQQKLFDSILDSRIKLQKGLTSSNSLPLSNEIFEEFQEDNTQEYLSKTEDSLHKLLDNIISLRTKIYNKEKLTKEPVAFKKSKKRSFTDYIEETEKLDNILNKYRGNVLTKWSHKVQSASGATALNASKFKTINQSAAQQVDLTLMDMDRLVKRTRLNRRNIKPLGFSEEQDEDEDDEYKTSKTKSIDRSLQEDENIFDDEDFYRVLLNDLIDKKISDSNPTNGLTIQLTKSKIKKNVDTKASKGRKLKYTVQEPIQNYEAPRDKFKWNDEQIDEFCAGLLGQRVNFNEDDEIRENDEDDEEDEGLANDDLKIFG